MIELEHVKKTYQTDTGPVEALTDVSININSGEIFGVIGYSGAGKSTLIRLINLLERPTSGLVKVDGQTMTELSEKELREARKQIGMIFQHFNLLWSRTVEENISFPLELAGIPKKERKSRVEELVRVVGLEGRESSYPSQLSGGQKQRVGIARALASNPKVLLCDEATSALDPKTTDSILQLLQKINRSIGITIVIITHEMQVIRKICDRVAVLDHGTIVEEGLEKDVFAHPEQQITKEFIGIKPESDDASGSLDRFRTIYPDGQIIRITFDGRTRQEPVLSAFYGHEGIETDIIESKLIPGAVKGTKGEIVLRVAGPEAQIQSVLHAANLKNVRTEVLSS
ncbi:methionine ABC transporter ATP-binding protein [Sporolactobacillus vineae]|uniref:methionine ABC transporter ATP-binding protein n=1 Tax=Sporolactobacillus vineae TaxID=444463 RepID=UPI000287BA3E|nr:ATP-binding cassette domain-containing protein [Sporolactobacillus vineae]